MKILFFGDIVGKIGRTALKAVLPEIKQSVNPDLILANTENLAHGTGVTDKTLQEMIDIGIDGFTSGNHIFDKPEVNELLAKKDSVLLRPANYPPQTAGQGYKIFSCGSRSVLVINLIGRVFIKENFDCPFRKIDEILDQVDTKKLAAVIVDFHAEVTSEKAAFGHYVDGRVSAVFGTHTHVPTADAKIMKGGTAFISDIGMVGPVDSIIGMKKEPIIEQFITQTNRTFEVVQEGEVQVNAVVVEIDPATQKVINIERLDRIVKV